MPDFHLVDAASRDAAHACPIICVSKDTLEDVLKKLPQGQRAWARHNRFKAAAGKHIIVPGDKGGRAAVLFGFGEGNDPFLVGALPNILPEGVYRFEKGGPDTAKAALAWALGAYGYDRYRKLPSRALLAAEGGASAVAPVAEGVYMARDLINAPANDMGPKQLQKAAEKLARRHDARLKIIRGGKLRKNFPLIHAVGMGSRRAPRLIDLRWGDKADPALTLVGKGVCFDSGGLDLKPPNAMAIMKKDMGGGANALGLAHMIMASGLKVRLRVLIPAVENAVSGRAFRPGDVFTSRKGLSVEIGNTDAEGRLVLADALTLADETPPDLLVSLATLTGAARVALGPDLPPFYTHDDELADEVQRSATATGDPVWRLPLWAPYDDWLKSSIADLNHITSQPFAGSVTAALFLNRFVELTRRYAHFDIFGWTPESRPARPKGGEAQAIRGLFDLLQKRYG
jgi:leucyl aminopeptidase